MGHCASQDTFTRHSDDAITSVPRKLKFVDDALLYDSSVSEAFWHTYDFLQRCMESGVTLRPDKFHFCRRSFTFAGYLLGWDGYQQFKMPAKPTLTDVWAWFGLVNQVTPFLAVASVIQPFRELLRKPSGRAVYWDKQLEGPVASAKDTIGRLAAEGLRFYDVSRPIAVLTDYSRQGLGFVVLQQYCDCISENSPTMLPRWVEASSLWQRTSYFSRDEL